MTKDTQTMLKVTAEQRREIQKHVNISSEEELQNIIDDLVKWYDSQEHLPRIKLDREIIESIFISRKASVSKTKEKIDSLFKARTIMPDLATPRDIFHPDIQEVFKAVSVAPMPKLNNDNTRVFVFRFTSNYKSYDIAHMCKYIFLILEYRLKFDYSSGDRFIFDAKEKTWRQYTKDYPHIIFRYYKFFVATFGSRVKSIHILNASSAMYTVWSLMKMILPKKLLDRIHIHSSYDELYSIIDKDILPKEYGGKENSLNTIMDEWNQELSREDRRKYSMSLETLRSDESKIIRK